jgi:hypothetical protein
MPAGARLSDLGASVFCAAGAVGATAAARTPIAATAKAQVIRKDESRGIVWPSLWFLSAFSLPWLCCF